MPLHERQWLDGDDVYMMLYHLRGQVRVTQKKAGRRRLRLFACACCRLVWGLLEDERGRRLVEVAERYSDDRATLRELTRARYAAEDVFPRGRCRDDDPLLRQRCALEAAVSAASPEIWETTFAFRRVAEALGGSRNHRIERASWGPMSPLLREIFDNPFRPVVLGDAPWLAWNDGTIGTVARTIGQEGTFDELPALLDALQEAGCDHEAILAHLRGPGPHVRGCWALDLLLGKA